MGKDTEESIGLGIEFLLQQRYKPIFNMRKKSRDGSWKPKNESKSKGAKIAPILKPIISDLYYLWDQMAKEQGNNQKNVIIYDYGKVVYPSRVYPVIASQEAPFIRDIGNN